MADLQSYHHHHFGPPTLNEQTNNHYNLIMVYCGFIVVVTVGLILGMYHCVALNWCTYCPFLWLQNSQAAASDHHQKFKADDKVIKLESSVFKYKKGSNSNVISSDECAVCLSVFEEGEEVRKLVRCEHFYHAPCIDMWLYSHFNCPLCRTPVGDVDGGGVSQSEESPGPGFSHSGALPV